MSDAMYDFIQNLIPMALICGVISAAVVIPLMVLGWALGAVGLDLGPLDPARWTDVGWWLLGLWSAVAAYTFDPPRWWVRDDDEDA